MPSSQTDKNLEKSGASQSGAASNGTSKHDAKASAIASESSRVATPSADAPSRGPRRLLKIADNYLFWQMVSSTLRGLVWFGGLLVLVFSISALQKALKQSLPVDAIFAALLYQLPRVFQLALPMSLLFGTVQTFSELSSKGEITALWAGGMGMKRMLRAPLLWGAVLAATTFLVQEYVVPASELRSAQVFEERLKTSVKTQQNFRYLDPPPGKGPLKLQILAQSFDAETNALINPHVTLYYEDSTQKLTIDAERGWADEKTGLWRFSNGLIRFFPRGERSDPAASGARNEQRFTLIENKLDGYGSVAALRQAGDLRTRRLMENDFELVSLGLLVAYRNTLQEQSGPQPVESTRRLISSATYGIHDKIATPLVCLALILVGAPLGIRPQRSSAGFAPGLSFLVIGSYYILWKMAASAAIDGAFNPYIAAYIGLFATTLVGVFLVWKKNR